MYLEHKRILIGLFICVSIIGTVGIYEILGRQELSTAAVVDHLSADKVVPEEHNLLLESSHCILSDTNLNDSVLLFQDDKILRYYPVT